MRRAEVEVLEREVKREDPIFRRGRQGFRRTERLERCSEVNELIIILSEQMLLPLTSVAVLMPRFVFVKRAADVYRRTQQMIM